MRRFLLIAHQVPVAGNFTLNDLAGGAGRMDEVARSVSNAFTLSNDLRRDTELTVLCVRSPPPQARKIRLVGARIRYLHPDERSTAALLKNALVRSIPLTEEVEASPGLYVAPAEPEREIRAFAEHPGTFWLSEGGTAIDAVELPEGEVGAVIADPFDFTDEESDLLTQLGLPRVSLGPLALRTSQCIDLFHNHLDRRAPAKGEPERGPGTVTGPSG